MSDLISPFELKQLRRAIGASTSRMAQLLGLSGKNDTDSLRKMENGKKPISGPIQRTAKFMQQGVAEGAMNMTLPEFMACTDLEGSIDIEWVIHTRYPRFLAIVSGEPIDGLASAAVDIVEFISVAMWIDEPVGDPQPYIDQAAALFGQYNTDSFV